MNALAKTEMHQINNKADVLVVLKNSLFAGAKDESISMALDYCSAAGFDIMQKPVHIVPMSVKNADTGRYEFRDVIMPGIGLYRIQADRSGCMAGISAPEFGPIITKEFTDKNGKSITVEFPEWCKITAKKIVSNNIVDFTAVEYWEENYATDSNKSTAPNAMWKKRTRGQLAKCTEAQALRKAFPEIGAQPIAEEMEGKVIETYVDSESTIEHKPERLPELSQEKFDHNINNWMAVIESGKKTAADLISMLETKSILTDKMINIINGEVNENA